MVNFFLRSKGMRQNFRGNAVLFLTPKDGQENKAESGQIGAGGGKTGGRTSPKEKSCLLSHSALRFRTKLLLSSIRSGPAETQTTGRTKTHARWGAFAFVTSPLRSGGSALPSKALNGAFQVRIREGASSSHPSIIHALESLKCKHSLAH